jgi:phage tail tape-measure protein
VSLNVIDKVAEALEATSLGEGRDDAILRLVAIDCINAMRDVPNAVLRAGFEAMFNDVWDGTEAALMGAGWDAMLTEALRDAGAPAIEK